MRFFNRRSTQTLGRRKPATTLRRRSLLLEKLEDRALMASDISISDAAAIEGSDVLKFIDRFVTEGSGGLAGPRLSTFGPDINGDGVGELYVASGDTDAILRYDGNTGAFLDTFVSSGSGGLNVPTDVDFGPDGNLYVSSSGNGKVLQFDGLTGVFRSEVASGLSNPHGLSFGSDGALFIATPGSHQVFRFNASGLSVFVPAGSGGLNLGRLAIPGPDGNGDGMDDLYVASKGTRQVLRYDGLTGAYMDVFATVNGGNLGWMEFGSDDYLYVAGQFPSGSQNVSLTRFDANTGVFVDAFSLGRDGWSFQIGPENVIYDSSNASGSFVERFGHSSLAAFTVSLSEPSSSPVTVTYTTSNGSAAAGTDYTAAVGTLTFAPGETTRTILVKTLNDAAAELSETFTVNLSNAAGATIADGQGVATIHDGSNIGPSLSISDVTISEGVNPQAAFSVNLSSPAAEPVTVDYSTADGTALAGINYVSTSGTLSFGAGETQRSILVPILNDGTTYQSESLTVNLSNAVGAVLADGQAVGTIEDHDIGDFKWTLRASTDGQMLESYWGNPVSPGELPVDAWPMNSLLPISFATDDLADDEDVIFIELPAGSDGPLGGILLDAQRGQNELIIKSGRVRIDSVSTGGTISTTVAAGAELLTTGLEQNEVNVNGRLTLLPGPGAPGQTSKVSGLTLGVGAILDLADNALIVDYTGASPLAAIREKILSGRGGAGFAASWSGTGINSSAAAAANAADAGSRSIAFAENAALPLGPYSTFRGQPVDATSVLIAYTRTGDANLDGLVNDNDVTIVNATYAPGVPQPSWALGDFDYNGFVDDDDVTLLGAFYSPAANPAPVPPSVVTFPARRDEMEHASRVTERQTMSPLAEQEDYTSYAVAIQQLLADADAAFSPKRKQPAVLAWN